MPVLKQQGSHVRAVVAARPRAHNASACQRICSPFHQACMPVRGMQAHVHAHSSYTYLQSPSVIHAQNKTGRAHAQQRGSCKDWRLTCLRVSMQGAGAWARTVGVHVTGARRDLWAPVLALLVSLVACVYCAVQLGGAVRPCAPSVICLARLVGLLPYTPRWLMLVRDAACISVRRIVLQLCSQSDTCMRLRMPASSAASLQL